jgi:hypothetical protein
MWTEIKEFFWWVYSWITVLAAAVLSVLVYLPPLLDVFAANARPLLPPDKAMGIMAAIGIAKGLCAMAAAARKDPNA